jgi:multiple sugar transport system substrate-binding protein
MAYFDTMSLPPTTVGGLTSSVVTNDEFISSWSNNVTATASTNPFWPYPESARMESILDEQIQAYLVGSTATAQEALDAAAAQISELIN